MKLPIQLAAVLVVLGLAGCAASSILHSWKSPAYHGGPVQKIAVIAVEDRGLVRQGFENRFVRDLGANGQEAMATHDVLGLQDIKANKDAAAARLREAGASSVLIVRLVNQATYDRQVRATRAVYTENITGIDSYYGWYGYFSVAYADMSTVWGSSTQKTYLDTSLYDLKDGQRLWSVLTLTTFNDNSDRLEEVDALVSKVVAAMQTDGMVR